MRRLRDVVAIFLLGAVAGTGAVALAAAMAPEPAPAEAGFVASTSALTASIAPTEVFFEEVVDERANVGDVPGLSEATLRTLLRHGALEASTETDLARHLHPAIVEVLVHRRSALAVFEESK
jgi:hypothetical protein